MLSENICTLLEQNLSATLCSLHVTMMICTRIICDIMKTLIRPYDVTLIHTAYAKCGNIQMAS